MKLNTILLVAVVAMSITACSSSPKNIGEQSRATSKQYDKVADDYRKGNKLIAKGEKELKKGRKLVKKGNDKIDKGQKLKRGAKSLHESLLESR